MARSPPAKKVAFSDEPTVMFDQPASESPKPRSAVSQVVHDALAIGYDWATSPFSFVPVAALVLLADAALCQAIIRYIPYTEIDWSTYMQQVALFLSGEQDYTKLRGDTGPLVYPAGHVFLYSFLHRLTRGGTDLPFAQQLFAGFYILSLGLVLAIYRKTHSVPPYALPLLILSKRLHSIFLLRLFNDPLALTVLYASVLTLLYRRWNAAAILYSLALSIKMNILLFLPGLATVLLLSTGPLGLLRHGLTILTIQAVLAQPFTPHLRAYLTSAFDLSRVFLYRWTVNWRFVPERTFLSRPFGAALLGAHLALLLWFGVTRWAHPAGGVSALVKRVWKRPELPVVREPLGARFIVNTLFTSNLVGILCARSLHYQFYSWYAHQTLFLAFQTPYPLPIKLALPTAIEYAWNVYPSTDASSAVLLAANAALLAGVWLGDRGEGKKHREGREKVE